jgi:hypothetical protein
MEATNYPNVNHPDFAPGRGVVASYHTNTAPAPPAHILRAMTGPRPYTAINPTALRVGDEVAVIGLYSRNNWGSGRITKIENAPPPHDYRRRYYIDNLPYPNYPGYIELYRPDENVYGPYFYPIRPSLTKDEAKGLAEISETYQLPHDVTGNIKEAITGSKPTRFRPGSKTGGRTRRTKKHKRTRRR